MEELFIPFEQALALKELGFDEMCFATYNMDYNVIRNPSHDMADLPIEGQPYYWQNSKIHINNVTAPLYQQVFKWFQTNNGLYHNVKVESSMNDGSLSFIPIVNGVELLDVGTYQQAELECIKKMIKICQK